MSSTTSVAGSSPVVSVASNGSGAAGGSVIDVSSLVSELVSATQAPQESLISNQTQAASSRISALGTFKSALSTFQSSLGALATPGAFGAVSASSSDPTAFTATADSSAVPATYSVEVSGLAQGQQLVSKAFSGGSAAVVGTGTLQVSLGGTSFNVSIDASNDTVAGIAAAINSATGNPGIAASVVTGNDGAHLVLTSSLTGAANTLQVSETDGGNALSDLAYSSANTDNYTEPSQPQDASFSIAGVDYTSPSNTVTDALSGVTLNLVGNTTSATTLTVSTNLTAAQGNIDAFVSAYNSLQGTLSSLGSYDQTTDTAGPMLGNALLSGIQNQIRNSLYSIVNTGSATYDSLASIGITTNKDGTLSVNDATLSAALSADFSAVSQLFSNSTSGVATTLNTQLTEALGANGAVTADSQTLVQQENALTQQSDQLNTQMAALTASLTQQYSSLNTLLSSLQSTSSYLSEAFATLPQVQGKPNA
ncbi:MAG: flagellar filament capping protein FliD [Steroidobacteraceae bacterium]